MCRGKIYRRLKLLSNHRTYAVFNREATINWLPAGMTIQMRILVDFHRIISDLGISRCEEYTSHFLLWKKFSPQPWNGANDNSCCPPWHETFPHTYLAGVTARSIRRGPVVEQTIAPRCCEAAWPVFKWVLANCIISVSVGIAFAQPHTPLNTKKKATSLTSLCASFRVVSNPCPCIFCPVYWTKWAILIGPPIYARERLKLLTLLQGRMRVQWCPWYEYNFMVLSQ